jgi:uncharacterized protein (DUF1499 family)
MKKSCLAILVCLGLASCSAAVGQGLENGRLRPCPSSPNCVSSEASDADLAPFELPVKDGWERLRLAIVSQGGSIEREEAGYLHATFRSRLFGFVDDLECRLDGSAIQGPLGVPARLVGHGGESAQGGVAAQDHGR